MKGKLGYLGLVVFCVLFAGCSNWFNAASSFPSAATLIGDCQAGKNATPPVRVNACDLYNAVQQFCLGQAMLPLNATQACALAGYQIQGSYTPQLKQ